MQYLPSREAAKILGRSILTPCADTADTGIIPYIKTQSGQRRYDVQTYLGNSKTVTPPSATAGSPATSSPATSNGRSPSCNSSTPALKSSPTSHPDSTTGARDSLPYWNAMLRLRNQELTAHAVADRGQDSAQGMAAQLIEQTCSQHLTWKTPGSQPARSQPPGGTHPGSTRHPYCLLCQGNRTPKVPQGNPGGSRICPDRQQRAKLKLWFDASRFTYNRSNVNS